jgi:predicted acylesterase/phospholipase RssA
MKFSECERLVFSGGGLRGIAYIGALLAIKDRTKGLELYDCPKLKEVVGCSIGSLIATFICMKVSVSEMHSFLYSLDLQNMFSVSYESVISTFAFNDGSILEKMVQDALALRNVPANITLGDFQKKYTLKLKIGITDLTTATYVLASSETMPSMPLALALVASMSLPPIFGPQKFNGHLYSDGGLINSFPLEGPTDIGFKLSWYVDPTSPMENILSYYTRVLSILQLPKEKEEEYSNVYSIDVGNFSAFRVDPNTLHETIVRLILNGYRQVNLQFDQTSSSLHDPLKFLNG